MKYPKAKSFHSPIHPYVRILSLILSLLCFFSFVPPLSFAQESTQTKEAAASDLTLDTEEALTYTELVERRDRFTKHFKRSDGKFVAIVYPEAIHTAENGVMVNLDNRLTKRASGRYENEGQGFLASFAPSISDTEPIRLSFEGYTLSWRVDIVRKERVEEKWQGVLSDATQASAAISPTVEAPRAASVGTVKSVAIADADERASFTEEEIKSTFMASSGMTYSQAFSGNGTVDLVYSLSDNKLEEDILVWDRGNIHSYVLTMNADGMTAVLNEDRSVTFVDAGGKDVFTISSPWMHDATYAFSDAINVSLAQKGNEVTVVYTPDAEWMTAKERVYPILIDPSVRSRNYTANYQDTFTYPTNTGDRSAITYMRVGKGNEAFFKLLHYPMALDAVDIESATLNFWGSANSTNLRMRVLTTPWDQSTLTYDNRPLGLSTVYTSTTATASTSTGWRVFNLMPAIQEYTYYHAGQSGFFNDYLEGFRIYHDSTTTQYLLISSESTDVQTRPYIEITYSYQYDNPIIDQGIYMIKNAASGRSLMNTASSTNVYQYSSAYSQGQAYRTRGGNGVYTFESLNRAGEALTYDYSGSNTQNTANVYTATLSESLADSQDFMLQYVTDSSQGYQLYAIVSRADTTMALTALGTTNGSPTGAGVSTTGNVVMSTYTGSTNQLWYFESGGQPVFVGNNIVAMNGDTLQYNYGVPESMIQPYGYITAYGERITWSSDNSDAITIAANGKVTINGAGKAVLTATVKNSLGTELRKYSYTVIISLANGLYRIKNKATGLYLGVDGTTYTSNTDIALSESITSGIEQYGQIWKIRGIGDGIYSIRLFPQQNLAMSNSNPVDIYDIGVNDTGTSVPTYAKWSFYWEGEDDYQIYVNNSISKGLTASNGSVISSAYTGADTQLWEFEPIYISEGLHILTDGNEINVGGMLSLKPVLYFENSSPVIINGTNVTWTSSNTANAVVNSSGSATGVQRGSATIHGSITINGSSYADQLNVQVLKKAIIIVPGIMGSRLVAGESSQIEFPNYSVGVTPPLPSNNITLVNQSDDLWSSAVFDYLESESDMVKLRALARISMLEMNSTGDSRFIVNTVSDTDMSCVENRYGVDCQYKDLYEGLQRLYGDSYEIRFFNYDWRYSNSVSAEILGEFIITNQYDGVTLVSHSMGGLVVSKLLSETESSNSSLVNTIENCVFIASPLLGSSTMAYILGSGDISDLIPNSINVDPSKISIYNRLADYLCCFKDYFESIPSLLINMPSLYELLPSEYYFYDYEGTNVLYEYHWYLKNLSGSTPTNFKTFEATENYLIDNTNFNQTLLTNAKLFHDSLWISQEANTFNHISSAYSSFYMVGTNVETSLRIGFDLSTGNRYVTDTTIYGDRMVTVRSAAIGFISAERTVYQQESHNEILSTDATLEFIARIISNENIDNINGLSYTNPVIQ